MSEPEPDPEISSKWPERGLSVEEVLRLLDDMVARTMEAVEALAGILTPRERYRILHLVEAAVKDRKEADLESLDRRFGLMEEAASLIAKAWRRP